MPAKEPSSGAPGASTPAAGSEDGPQAKRLKTNSTDGPAGVINSSVLSADSRSQLRSQHDASEPYKHVVLRDVVSPKLLRGVRDEIINNIHATYKETDLFKVFQTGDLANMDSLDPDSAAKLPNLMALRDALYSAGFRQFVRDITGCGELSDGPDCSCNVYTQGGHLLCHDDVIGSRRVSYIVYLTDPDDPWTAEDGGALELYPLLPGEPPMPDVTPSERMLPHWNSMAMFTVQPGRSFHSVQEVFTDDKPRLSISGWYHAPAGAAPTDAHQASLAQLQMAPGQDAVTDHTPFPSPADALPTDEDLAVLGRWVNPAYLSPKSWPQIQRKFEADGSIQLQGFLHASIATGVLAAALAQDKADAVGRGQVPDYAVGCSDGWEAVGPPHKQRYLRYSGPAAAAASECATADDAAQGTSGRNSSGKAGPSNGSSSGGGGSSSAVQLEGSAGAQLAALKAQVFESGAFGRLLKAFTTVSMTGHHGEVRRMRPGLDYTVAHYGVLTKDPRLDCVLCFVDDGTREDAEAWGCGEVGGFEAYLLADEDSAAEGAPEVYRQREDDAGVINVPAASNSLNLLLRDEGLMRFVKYVGAAAPSSRWDVAMEYRPEDDDSEEEQQ